MGASTPLSDHFSSVIEGSRNARRKYLMRKLLLYLLILCLYLATPYFLIATINSSALYKDQVEMAYFAVDIDMFLTEEVKRNQLKKIDKEDRRYKIAIASYFAGSIISFVLATGLLIKRKKIINRKRKNTY
jgi:hypothetical protein